MVLATKEAHLAAVKSNASSDLLLILSSLSTETAHRIAEVEGKAWLLESESLSSDDIDEQGASTSGGLTEAGCELQCEAISCVLALACGAATPKGAAPLAAWAGDGAATLRELRNVVKAAVEHRPEDSLLVQTGTDLLEKLVAEERANGAALRPADSLSGSAGTPEREAREVKMKVRRVSYSLDDGASLTGHGAPADGSSRVVSNSATPMPGKKPRQRRTSIGGTPLVAVETQERVHHARSASRQRIDAANKRFAETEALELLDSPPLSLLVGLEGISALSTGTMPRPRSAGRGRSESPSSDRSSSRSVSSLERRTRHM
jgi:hypothetical protein